VFRHQFPRTAFILVALNLLLLLTNRSVPAQGEPQPRTVHNACAGNCVADVIFLHSGMGDTQARYAYNAWFDTYYELTGCGDPAWKTDLLFLLDIVGNAVGAPGAPTMQCWQGLAAQANLCGRTCSEYFIPDARYGPNVEISLDQGSPGYLEVTLDNQSSVNNLPELASNAYSRRFSLKTYLSHEGGEALLVNDTPMPSLSFPNWITRGGLDVCSNEYGFESSRCQILASFDTPGIVSASVEFLDGAFYDLSGQVSDLSDASGSFSTDGYIRLLRDGDSITIAQGPYAGYTLVKTHYLSDDTHTVQLQAWDASSRAVTITNEECNSWLSTCWATEARREADTYVYAMRGPADKVLAGSYTVEVVADIPHDKDFTDNRVSYSYDASAATGGGTVAGGEGGLTVTATPPPGVDDLPVIDIPGPGIWPATIGPDLLGHVFRLAVPDEVSFMFLRLVPLDGGQYSAFVRRGSIPVPDYPVVGDNYQCWIVSDAEYSAGCPFSNPYPDDYYIFVHRESGGGAYRLEVEWTFPPTATVTPTSTLTATLSAGATGTPTATPGQPGGTGAALTEVEPNNTYAEANTWDMQGAFTGEVAAWSDRDKLLLNFTASGIYTFSLTDAGPELRAQMSLYRATTYNLRGSGRAAAEGAPVSFTFDASAGEQYYLVITAIAMSPATHQPYTLRLTGFVPDPDESNDDHARATPWDLAAGPVSGYFWDETTGHCDYFTFLAPPTLDGSPITFALTNPAADLRIRLTLLRDNGLAVASTAYSVAGQPVTLSRALVSGRRYYLKLETQFDRTSLLPYVLSATYTPAAGASPTAALTALPTATRVPPRPTSTPLPTATPPLPTVPPPDQPVTIVSGYVWRLFPGADPVGVGAASVILAVNGVEQPAVLSMIDGSYRIEAAGVQPGDQLSLRAAGAEDTFEPAAYQWQAEAGVSRWAYDFYSYWGTITPPASDDQNRVYGYVRDAGGNGVAGVRVLVQMGTSDALQVLGPTDASGYYEGYVRLPGRIMVGVWTETPGYLPSRVQFFHAYAPENREVSFTQGP